MAVSWGASPAQRETRAFPVAALPTVSVVMSVYNGQSFVAEALESILSQTLEDFEVVVVDDGSTDETPSILRRYRDPRVRIETHATNRGLTPSLNRGLSLAKGEFIARHDADDISEPQRLAQQVDFLRRHDDVALVGSGYRTIDAAGRVLSRVRLPISDIDLRWSLCFICPFIHSAAVWRRIPIDQVVGRYNETFNYAQDWDLWTRISSRFPVANLSASLVRYREVADSLTATHPAVDTETVAIRHRGIAGLLGKDPGDLPFERSARLFHLLYGTCFPDAPPELEAALEDLEQMLEAFSCTSRTSPPATAHLRKRIRRTVATRLLRQAHLRRRQGSRKHGRDLFSRACSLDPMSLLSVKGIRYLIG
jgi:hypothetical protein